MRNFAVKLHELRVIDLGAKAILNRFQIGAMPRWAKATDRQRELLQVVSILPNADNEFTVQECSELSKRYAHQTIYPKPCEPNVVEFS
jgi:hypothetical protein